MSTSRLLSIPVNGAALEGDLTVPDNALGLVIFAHGAGSGRLSPRNSHVAALLQAQGLATLLIDLLTPREDLVYENRFDIDLISGRMARITVWLQDRAEARGLSVCYFGASTGSAAALKATVEGPVEVRAIVSRGGRPDLVSDILPGVRAPTLLIVGGSDPVVIGLNEKAFGLITAEKELRIVPGATHLFEEPGALDEVARLAGDWFRRYLS